MTVQQLTLILQMRILHTRKAVSPVLRRTEQRIPVQLKLRLCFSTITSKEKDRRNISALSIRLSRAVFTVTQTLRNPRESIPVCLRRQFSWRTLRQANLRAIISVIYTPFIPRKRTNSSTYWIVIPDLSVLQRRKPSLRLTRLKEKRQKSLRESSRIRRTTRARSLRSWSRPLMKIPSPRKMTSLSRL